MTPEQKAQDLALAHAVIAGGWLEDSILDLWQRTRIDWSFASGKLAAHFRNQRNLASDERRFISETLYGMIRHLRRLDHALALGGHTGATHAADRRRLRAYLVLECALPPERAAAVDAELDWSRVAGVDDALARERDAVRRIGLSRSLPDWLVEVLVAERGADDADALAAALNQRAPMTVRANRLRGDREALAAALASEGIDTTPGRYGADALEVVTRTNLFGLAAFRAGLFEAQDEGSQLIAELVAPPPRSVVVDYCAGAGGKTLALSAMLEGRGRVVACDVVKPKLAELKRRAKRAGAGNVQSVVLDERGWAPPLDRLTGAAQRVLVDAPCTGIGALRRNPEIRWRLSPDELSRMPQLQRSICERALELVAPGGRLIYATCTVIRAENRAVVEALRAAHPELEPVPAKDVWGKQRAQPITDADSHYLEVLPHVHGTDGFFAAVLRRPK